MKSTQIIAPSNRVANLRVTGLKVDRCEHFLGLGNASPRLSWYIESDRRSVRQSAYRIRIGSSAERLRAGDNDLWDSGRIESRQSVDIEYAGQPLASRQRCWWTVEVSDEQGNTACSAGNDWWEMGLLKPADWSALWLAVEDRVARGDREAGLHWIWCEDASAGHEVNRFRWAFELPEESPHGELIVAVKQSWWWSQITRIWLDGEVMGGPGSWIAAPPAPFDGPPGIRVSDLTSQRIVLKSLTAGRHVLAMEVGIRPLSSWFFAAANTPPNVPGLASLCRFELKDGETLRMRSGIDWKANSQESADARWYDPDFDDSQWGRARPDPAESYQPWPAQPAMHFRKTFAVDKKIAKARLYATALGVYEARLNGQKVGDEVLTPGPAQYDRRIPYQVFDVGALVQAGENALALTVADGWYAGFDGRFAFGPPPCRVIAQLELTDEDGSRQMIETGPGWRMAESAVRSSQIKVGEVQDHRLEQPGWDRVGFDDAHWEEAAVAERPSGELVAQSIPPIRIQRKIKPQAIIQTADGHYVIDFGLCFTGWCELHVTGKAGAKIEVGYSERIQPSGQIDPLRMYDPTGEPRRDVFFLRGDPAGERLSPRFVYRGLRYVQVSGLELAPDADRIDGVFIYSDLEPTATIRSDQEIIQGTFNLALQSLKSNSVGVPVDNSTREVRGHIGSAAVFCPAATYLMDVSTFLPHHVSVIVGEQTPEGNLPIYAPCPPHAKLFPHPPGDEPSSTLSVIWVVWQCWRQYGDTQVMVRHWPAMTRNVQFILDHNPNCLWLDKRYFDYGDWLGLESTPKDLMASAFWAQSVRLLAQMAEALGEALETQRLLALQARIRKAFNAAYVKADGTIGNGSQASCILALAFDLLDAGDRSKAVEKLIEAINSRSPPGLTTGVWSTPFILDVLTDSGRGDLAYELLTSTSFPSWGYMLKGGATAVWEYWDGKIGTRNQSELGTVASFIMKRIAGIEAAAPGFEAITIRPLADPRLNKGGGDYESVMGRISTDWTLSEGRFTLEVTIPANTTACIHLPAPEGARIEESQRDILDCHDLRLIARNAREAQIAVGSGKYRFVVMQQELKSAR